ncbi:hypothetical protein Vretifemale_4792 [Volvox reticuliferus]|uniref:Peptidase M11 gametolysin domain-containing protein n=1 Tax=Volvox reticuliferus TaxID=1737510 RepID=A0A8J4C3N0_9CHLO|nr:hypothetical protein Vretifemale_4792 [Volvox reticuliferus]
MGVSASRSPPSVALLCLLLAIATTITSVCDGRQVSRQAPFPSSPPSSEIFWDGELDVLLSESSTFTILRTSNGSALAVLLDNDTQALQFAGHLVRIRIESKLSSSAAAAAAAVSSSPSPSPSPPPATATMTNTHKLLFHRITLADNAVRAQIVQVFGFADKNAPKDAPAGARNITSAIFLLSFRCNNWTAPFTASSFWSMWLNGPSTPRTAKTMQNYWDFCSQGAARMSNETQFIFEVPVPCNGTSNNQPYNFISQCTEAELYAWMDLADSYVQNTLKRDISRIKQRIAVLPTEVIANCKWAGMGSVGCSGTRCYSWINGAAANELSAYMHEMGHNMGLQHSGRAGYVSEYSDQSCTMGSGRTCFNAPNMWRLNWAAPLPGGDLNGTTLEAGRWKKFVIPNQSGAPQSFIRVNPTWTLITGKEALLTGTDPDWAPAPVYYIAFRFHHNGFESFTTENNNRVHVYSFQGTQSVASPAKPILHAVLNMGAEFRSQVPYGLVVNVIKITAPNGNATVTICRASGESEAQGGDSCSDGRDNDCDGLMDDADPDCGGALEVAQSPFRSSVRWPPAAASSPPKPSSSSSSSSSPQAPSLPQQPPSLSHPVSMNYTESQQQQQQQPPSPIRPLPPISPVLRSPPPPSSPRPPPPESPPKTLNSTRKDAAASLRTPPPQSHECF